MSARSDLVHLQATQPAWFVEAFDVPREECTVPGDDGEPAIHYFRWGDPCMPGVVLTHGFMAHARCWAFIAPLLAEKFCLVAFDLSGMGDSGSRVTYTADLRANETHRVAEHAGLLDDDRQPALVCHSYGGSVGLVAAEMFPETWSSLTICDMSLLAPGEPSNFAEHRKAREGRALRPHKIHENATEAMARFRLAPDQPCENDFLIEYMAYHSLQRVTPNPEAGQSEAGWRWKFDPAILGPDEQRDTDWFESIAQRLVALKLPRAIIHGQHSEMMSLQAQAYIRDASGGAIVCIDIPAAYHHIMLDQPLALTTALDALLTMRFSK